MKRARADGFIRIRKFCMNQSESAREIRNRNEGNFARIRRKQNVIQKADNSTQANNNNNQTREREKTTTKFANFNKKKKQRTEPDFDKARKIFKVES
jgi:hypothetical protein